MSGGQLAPVSPEKLLDLFPLERYVLNCSVDFIQQHNHFYRHPGRRCPAGHGIERSDPLRLFIIKKREVLLLQSGDQRTRLIGHDHIQSDAAIRDGRRGRFGRILLGEPRRKRKAE